MAKSAYSENYKGGALSSPGKPRYSAEYPASQFARNNKDDNSDDSGTLYIGGDARGAHARKIPGDDFWYIEEANTTHLIYYLGYPQTGNLYYKRRLHARTWLLDQAGLRRFTNSGVIEKLSN